MTREKDEPCSTLAECVARIQRNKGGGKCCVVQKSLIDDRIKAKYDKSNGTHN